MYQVTNNDIKIIEVFAYINDELDLLCERMRVSLNNPDVIVFTKEQINGMIKILGESK